MKRKILFLFYFIAVSGMFFSFDIPAKALDASNIDSKIDINDPSILKEQADIFYKNGRYLQALTYISNVKDSDIDEASLIIMANCYDTLGDMKKAMESLVKASEMKPKSANPYYNMGILYYKNGNLDLAVKSFEKAIKRKHNFKEAYYNLGNSYFLQKNYKLALVNYKKAYKIDPYNESIAYNLSLTYENLKNKKQSKFYEEKYKSLISL